MHRLVLLTIAVVAVALVAATAVTAKSTPKAGSYSGDVDSTVRDVRQRISFDYKRGKKGKGSLKNLGAYFPMECSGDGFDIAFGNNRDGKQLKGKVSASGKISTVVDQVNLLDPSMNLQGVPAADMKMELKGKITGARAKGTWTVSSTNGFPCSGKGTWAADKS